MPRRKSLTRRFLQHLLLISLARTILTVLGRGRAWDEWDERKLVEPAQQRSFQRRFVQTFSFGALFFAGLALSAGAGNGVRSLLDEGSTTSAAQGASGASGPTGAAAPVAPTRTVLASQPARSVEARQAVPARPVVTPPATTRTAVAVSSKATRSALRPGAAAVATKQRTAIARTHTARPARAHARPHRKAPATHPA